MNQPLLAEKSQLIYVELSMVSFFLWRTFRFLCHAILSEFYLGEIEYWNVLVKKLFEGKSLISVFVVIIADLLLKPKAI